MKTEPAELTFDTFAAKVLAWESKPEAPMQPFNHDALMLCLRIIVIVCNHLDLMKKSIFYGKPMGEMGAISWVTQEVLKVIGDSSAQRITRMQDQPYPLSMQRIDEADDTAARMRSMRIFHSLIGMVGEWGGELAHALLHAINTGDPIDIVNMWEEVGDGHVYEAFLLDVHGVGLEHPLSLVLRKLMQRYGERFTPERALNRDLDAERRVMEDGR